jgi:hypothetical protein
LKGIAVARIQEAANAPDLPLKTDLGKLEPSNLQELQELASYIPQLSDRELQLLGAVLAGTAPNSPTTLPLLREGLRRPDPTTALSCLLAPKEVPLSSLPSLAWLAVDSGKAIELRAAALCRLLSARCKSAWPLARSLLLTGTRADTPSPFADWPRTGRYELPKRLLVLQLDEILAAEGRPPCGIEPNASWLNQVQQVSAFEEFAVQVFQKKSVAQDSVSREDYEAFSKGIAKLLQQPTERQLHAIEACSLLLPHALPTLRLALTKDDPQIAVTARRVLESF